MKTISVSCLLLVFFCGCGEHEVKRMIIEPHPPEPLASAPSCHVHFARKATLKEAAVQAAKISEECNFTDEEFKNFTHAEFTELN